MLGGGTPHRSHRVGQPVWSGRDDVQYLEKDPPVMVKSRQSLGTPQGDDQVLTT